MTATPTFFDLIQKIVKKNPSIMKLLKKGETEGGEND